MAREDRPAAEHLTLLARASEDARRWEPWALLRAVEARGGRAPRIGRSRLPAEDLVEVAQDPAPGFAPAAVIRIEPSPHGRWRVVGRWFGLLGSMGPLPLHWSEYAHQEGRGGTGRPFGRFLDLIARRMQQLFFRAWADGSAAAQADRPDDDRFAGYVARLTGAAEGASAAGPFPPPMRLAYAALFASRRSAVAIEDACTHLLGAPVRLLEYQPRHREVEPEDRTRLGRAHAALGGGAMLGHRVRVVTDAFRVMVRPPDARGYRALLPGQPRHRLATAALDAFAPGHLEWDMALEIGAGEAWPARLDGSARLGWTSWIGPGTTAAIRRDAHLRRASGKEGTRA